MILLVLVLAGFALACATAALHRVLPRLVRVVLVLAALAMGAAFLAQASALVRGAPPAAIALPWAATLGVSLAFRGDALSILFALLVTGVGALVLAYTGGYLRGHPQLARMDALLLLFLAAMLGLVLADDAVLLFVFWELTTLASYLLVGFDHERPAARAAARRALLVTAMGGLALLAGVLMLGGIAGTYRISELLTRRDELGAHPLFPAALALVVLGALTKSAQVPFHGWLPGAMEAPAPVSAFLHAAAMVKAGIYVVARFAPLLDAVDWLRTALVAVGAASMLLGGARGLVEADLKRILAWSTVSALGMLVLLLGVGSMAAAVAALAFLVAHALYKGALFLAAGAVDHETGVRDVDRLGGLGRTMPRTAAASILAAASMAGLPLFLGFAAKEAGYAAVLARGDGLLAAALVAGSAGFFAHAVRAGGRPFLGARPAGAPGAHDPGASLWGAPLLLAVAGAALGLWPGAVGGLVALAAAQVVPGAEAAPHLTAWHGFGAPLLLSAAGALLGLAALRARSAVRGAVARLSGPPIHALALSALEGVARRQTRIIQNGNLRSYLLVTVLVAVALVGPLLLSRGGAEPAWTVGTARFHEVVVGGLVLAAAGVTIRVRSRLGAIVATGVVGYGVGLLFLFFGAPDLAMTQFVVETLTVILLVLAFRQLPRFAELSTRWRKARDALVAGSVGIVMGALVLFATAAVREPRSAEAMLAHAVPDGHGRNVVNVILVDFRALDTLGEITVLSIGAFGVVALLRLRAARKEAQA
jgi:multicomponent Na+:H+ antiporter subunit A